MATNPDRNAGARKAQKAQKAKRGKFFSTEWGQANGRRWFEQKGAEVAKEEKIEDDDENEDDYEVECLLSSGRSSASNRRRGKWELLV